jgi:hypothetical protein
VWEIVAMIVIMKFNATSTQRNGPEPGRLSLPINPTKARIAPNMTKYMRNICNVLALFLGAEVGVLA